MLHALQDAVKLVVIGNLPASITAVIRKYRRRHLIKAYASAGLVFFHVPRTAGTSISSALYGMPVNHFPIAEMTPLIPPALDALPRFAIVRIPWDRAVSAWSFARMEISSDRRVAVRNAWRYRIPQFRTFEHFVHDWLARQDLRRVDGMFRQQASFLVDADGSLPLDHIGRFENLPATESWLRAHSPAMRTIPHLNAAPREPYRAHYTPASRDAIARIYGRDIALFGYDY